MLDHFRAIQKLLQLSTAGLTHPFLCFPVRPQMPLLLHREAQCLSPAGLLFVQCKSAQALRCLYHFPDPNASSRAATWLVHSSASALSKTSLPVWFRYVKFVTSTVGSIDALVPPTPNLTRYKRELAVKAEEAAVTGRNSPKSAK